MRTVIAILIGLLFLAAFYFLFSRAFILAFGKNFIKKHFNRRRWLIFGGLAGLGALLIVFAVSKNSGIYAWDSGGYWHWSYSHTDQLYEDPGVALGDLWDSIIKTDYNLIIPTIISLPLRIFGYTFMRYTLINYLLFLVPTFFIMLCIFLKITSKNKRSSSKTWLLALFMVACFVVPFDALLKGYIDVAELIPISLLLALFLKYQPTKAAKSQIKLCIMIGILLVTTFLFRRYTAFFVAGYAITLVVYSAFCLFRQKRLHRKRPLKDSFKNAFLQLLIAGGTALAILLIFFNGLVFRILGEDYATLYSAYNADVLTKLDAFPAIVGYLFIVLAIFAVIYSLIKREHRKISIFCAVSIAITTLAFWRVQIMGCHQMYTVDMQILTLDFLGLYFIINMPRKLPLTLTKIAVVILIALEPLNFFFARVQRITAPIQRVFSERFIPIYRADLAELRALRDYLNKNSDGNYVYVLASSTTLNSDILKVMDRPKTENAVSNLVNSHDIDLRDGFPNIFFAAHTVVTGSPAQTHLKEGSQEIIRYLAELIQNPDSYLGRHFVKDEHVFQLDKGVKAYVYHKISPLNDEDYDKLVEYFDNLYPEQHATFKDRIRAFQEEYKNSDHSKEFYYTPSNLKSN